MRDERLFYVDPENIRDNSFILNKSESIHAINVLRLNVNDKIILIDGSGKSYLGIITIIQSNIVEGTISNFIDGFGENKITINIAPSIIKRNRFEIMIEKATELGVKKIEPLIMHRSMRKMINMDRCEKIILSAAKQCKRSSLPVLCKPVKFIPWMEKFNGQCVAGNQSSDVNLKNLDLDTNNAIQIIIGPEGDYSQDEINVMDKSNVKFFTLGDRRLRAETAMMSSISILNEILN